MINTRLRLLSAILLLSAPRVLSADEPAWVFLEYGKAAYEQRDLTESLDYLLEAVELEPEYPEAEFWLGRVYEAQGQPVLAEEQYRRAIALSPYLRVPEDSIQFRYALADLLLARGPERALESEAILYGIADDEGASTPSSISLDHQYIKLITESGLDELLFLYRDELATSLKARRILGENAWKRGNYRTSLLHSTRVVLSMLSTAASLYISDQPDWRFDIDPVKDAENPDRDIRYPGLSDGSDDLINRVYSSNDSLVTWMDDEGFWPQLYLLSVSLYANGFPRTAESIWNLMIDEDMISGEKTPRPESGIWGRLAQRQLNEPFISTGSLSP